MTSPPNRQWRWRVQQTISALAALVCSTLASLAAAQEFYTLKGHGGPIKGIGAGDDGTILTASFDNSVGLWQNNSPTWLEGHEAAVNAVLYLGDGRVVSASDDFSVRLWDKTGKARVLGRHLGKVIRLAVSPDGTHVASASWDGSARIWPLPGESPVIEIKGHTSVVNDVAYSPDGTRLYSASADGTIRVWDATTGTPLQRLVRHGFGINTIVVSLDHNWVAYGAVDGAVRVVRLSDDQQIHDFTADRRPILAMAYHPGVSRIAVGDAHGYIMMIDTQNWRISNDFRATLSGPIWALAFSPDGQNIHAGGLDNALYSWPITNMDDAAQMANTSQTYLTPPGEMSNGERQFQRKCSICHALGRDTQRRAGPTLHKIFGRPAGGLSDYPYSKTLRTSDIIWTEETIDLLFDHGPDHYIPGSKMPMQRITGQTDRADLVGFLKRATQIDQ